MISLGFKCVLLMKHYVCKNVLRILMLMQDIVNCCTDHSLVEQAESLKNSQAFLSFCLTFWKRARKGKVVPERCCVEFPPAMSLRLHPHGVFRGGKTRFQKSYLYPSVLACNRVSRGTRVNRALRILYQGLFCCRPGL